MDLLDIQIGVEIKKEPCLGRYVFGFVLDKNHAYVFKLVFRIVGHFFVRIVDEISNMAFCEKGTYYCAAEERKNRYQGKQEVLTGEFLYQRMGLGLRGFHWKYTF